MLKNPFSNQAYTTDEADVVAINDNRHAALNRFRRLTTQNDKEESIQRDPALMLAKLVEKTDKNGVYVNQGLVMDDERSVSTTPGLQTPPKGGKVAVDVRDVTFTYGFGKKSLLTLKKINVSVPQGKIYALLGSSGCGKSCDKSMIVFTHE